ncbi:MAG: Mov34/MPN/PAD-1 family protein [Halodesulfurarchaeum sp.]
MIELRPSVRAGIVGHARAAAPAEACGLLGGRDADPATVTVAIPTPNVADRPRDRYVVDPEALVAGHDALEADGQALLGFYHSHPRGPAEPSAIDRERARWPDHLTVIVSLTGANPTLSGFVGDGFGRQPIESPRR